MAKRGKANYHEKRCINCDGIFHSVRSDAKYCGEDCKSHYRYHVVLKNGGNVITTIPEEITIKEEIHQTPINTSVDIKHDSEPNKKHLLKKQMEDLYQEASDFYISNKHKIEVLKDKNLINKDNDYKVRINNLRDRISKTKDK